ncbi:hypothetical protein [Microbispora sp. NPDC049633]|uniref:hypothetical protein n=1 Tax=Microbispora sp. NPDC049633 TaxID=3154355 RepID=UPI0034292ACC
MTPVPPMPVFVPCPAVAALRLAALVPRLAVLVLCPVVAVRGLGVLVAAGLGVRHPAKRGATRRRAAR